MSDQALTDMDLRLYGIAFEDHQGNRIDPSRVVITSDGRAFWLDGPPAEPAQLSISTLANFCAGDVEPIVCCSRRAQT